MSSPSPATSTVSPPSDSGSPSRLRILELDGLRGVAALAVVLYHFTTRFEQLFPREVPLSWQLSWGFHGVDLFFMLSGFVILMTLERTRGWLQFAWGRFTRLYPAYWVAALMTLIVIALWGAASQQVSARDALLNVTMLQALLGARHIDGVYWSLQAEVIFYVNMLLAYRCGLLQRPAWGVAAWLLLAAIVVAALALVGDETAIASVLHKLQTVFSLKFIPLFSVGVLLYDARVRARFTVAHAAALTLGLALIGLSDGVATLVIDTGLAALLALAVHGRCRWLGAPWLVRLGALSYALYLVHQAIGYTIIRHLEAAGAAPAVSIAAALVTVFLLANGLHRWIEMPALHRLRHVRVERLAGFWSWSRKPRGANPA